jgi:hypothetical protein
MRMGMVVFAAALALAGCGGGGNQQAAALLACPTPGLLPDAVDLTRYRGGQGDMTALMLDARITGIVNGRCTESRERRGISMQFSVALSVERGPAAEGRQAELPLVIAVLESGGQVLRRQVVTQVVSFPASGRANIASEAVELVLPVSQARRATDYQVVVGFLLNEQELAANRRRGPR